MIKQVVYNLEIVGEEINIIKGEDILISISMENKSLDLKQLYDNMMVNIDDKYFFKKGIIKYEKPQNDVERIFNNVYDFLVTLLSNLNKKLEEIRNKEEQDIFE